MVDENYSDISNSRTLGCGEGLRRRGAPASAVPDADGDTHGLFDRIISFGI